MIFRNMEAVNEIVNQTKDASTIQKANRYNVICGLLRGLYRGQGYGPVSYNRKRLPKPRTATNTAKRTSSRLVSRFCLRFAVKVNVFDYTKLDRNRDRDTNREANRK